MSAKSESETSSKIAKSLKADYDHKRYANITEAKKAASKTEAKKEKTKK